MQNLLSTLASEVSQKIVIKQYQDALPEFKDESDQIKDEEAKKKYKETLSNAKEDMEKRGQEMLDEAGEKAGAYIRQMRQDFNDLGTDLGHLAVGTAQFSARLAIIPAAIISVTPMGPGVSANLVMPLAQQLKAEGDNLSKTYDNCNSKMSKLGLAMLAPSIPVISSVMSIADATMAAAKVLIAIVGANVGDIVDAVVPDIEIPISIPDLSAVNCTAFSPKDLDLTNISASNCTKFTPLVDTDTTVACNNCKYYNQRL